MAEKPKVKMTQLANPWAHIEARKGAEEEAKKKKRMEEVKKSKEEVRTKSWMDYPFDMMRRIGDYARGVERK